MYVLGHLGIASGLGELFGGRDPLVPIDFRAVLVGSMLADAIDKPLGMALGIDGRNVAHTAVFAVALTLLGLWAASRGRTGVGWLAFGNWTHLALDGMWWQPGVLLYPAYGWAFPPATITVFDLIRVLLENPLVWAGEAVGGTLLLVLAVRYGVTSRAALKRFLATGQVASRP